MRHVRIFSALALVAGIALAGASQASAQGLPPEVGEAIDSLPPEVRDPVNQVVADAVAALLEANVDGVGQAESSPGHSSASAVEFPDVLVINKSETTKDSAKVTRLSLLGQPLLVKDGDATGGANSGDLAAVGDVIDQVNDALCPAGRAAPGQCVTVMDANATSTGSPTTSGSNNANSAVASVATGGGTGVWSAAANQGVSVLPNSATTIKTRIFGTDRCSDFATNSLLGGKGTAALLSIVGLKVKVGGILAPC